jgi:uncharacterized SAM-binding protein YcdF (DUF218 family)
VFFYLSKIIFFLIRPSNFLLILLGFGFALLFTKRRKLARFLVGTAFIGILVLGLSPAANLLILPLEERFPIPGDVTSVDGIIVLGGTVDTIVTSARPTAALTSSAERLTIVPMLAQAHPNAVVVHSGGEGLLMSSGTSEAEGAGPLWESFGIAPERIVLENRSRNTWENAVFTKKLIDPKPGQTWLLVTSAYHMPRSMGVFRAAGWSGVIAYPVDHRTRGWEDKIRGFAGVSEGLRRFDIAFREWVGLVAYWLTGRNSDLFPAP